ncbi:MAG: hypothetical protein M3Q75_12370, partial [Gemmatimonadota bacterium]|nr:hypothetical protein [Gemmatimonadota bacterium]
PPTCQHMIGSASHSTNSHPASDSAERRRLDSARPNDHQRNKATIPEAQKLVDAVAEVLARIGLAARGAL